MLIARIVSGLALAVALAGCATFPTDEPTAVRPSALTPGMAQRTLVVGQSTQAEVLEVFGPPDLVTKSGRAEMWGYDKIATERAYGGFGLGVGGGGLVGTGALGGIASGHTGYSQQSTKSVLLLIYFNEHQIVTDYKLSATRF